jgi:hypothetical protein
MYNKSGVLHIMIKLTDKEMELLVSFLLGSTETYLEQTLHKNIGVGMSTSRNVHDTFAQVAAYFVVERSKGDELY